MAITFLDEEEDIVAAAEPTKGKGRVTFLDEEEPVAPSVEPATAPATKPPKITFLDKEPQTPSVGGIAIPPAPEVPKLEARKPEEGMLRPVADPFLNIGASINDVVKGFTDAFGADNPVSRNLAKNSEWYRSLLSAGAKQDQEEIGRIMQEAEGQGVLTEIGAGLKALSVAPVDLVSQGIGSLIPFIATAGVGKAVGLSKAGIAVLQGVQGGVVGGGIVKGEIYDAVKEQLVNSGVDKAKAEKAAMEAQSYNGKNLDQIFLGVGLGVAASTTGADSAIRSLISRKVGKEAAEAVSERAIQEVLRTGFVRGAVKDGAVEFATEALQGGQERLAANVAVGREGFDVEPMRGVVGQAVLEGALGGILGGGAGGISAKVSQMDTRKKVALRDAQKAAEEAKQSNAPASAAAVEEQINQTIEETPDEKVARLQREAQEAAGDIELEEEPPVSGLPPERIKSARWFESAARNRLKELQDKDDAGVEDFTTQERDEFEFLKTSPTPEQIAERYGYGVAPAVEPTAVTTTTPPTAPAATAPVEPEPTLTPTPAATEPAGAAIVEDADPNNPPVNSMGQLVRFKAPARKGSLVTDGDGRRGDIVSEDGTKITVEWRDGTTSTVDESEVKRSVQRDMKARNAVAVEESRVGNYTIVGVFFTDTQGVSRKIFERRVADTQSDTDYAQAVKEATDRASQYALENNLAGYGTKEGDFISQPTTPTPTTPTAEAPATPALAPVEPVVTTEGAVEPTAVAAPTEPVAPTEPAVEPVPAVAPRPAVDVEALSPNAKRANRILTNTGVDPETAAFVAQQYQDEIADLGGEELRAFVLDKFEENGGVIPAQMRYSEDQEYYELAFGIGPEEAATLVENAKAQNAQMAQNELEQNKQWRRKDEQVTEAQQGVAVAQPEAQAVPLPAGEVPPSPAIEGRRVPLAAPEAAVAPAIPQLEPLRRVARAEQTEEDVAGLVDAGFVEVYNGQPVITQAGLEALPETERPRLTPEARKIQIDTRTSEAAAEAISKNLRIGVDQVPVDVRMPAGWTLVGDVYVPPTRMEKIAGFDVLEDYEVQQTADVFQSLYGKRPPVDTEKILADARAKRAGRPEELSVRPLRPRDYLNITVREALRKAATFNFLKGTRSEKFADIAAILAESPIPALSDEEIVSLGSKGRRGREARWIGGDIGMASTKGMEIETFIHEVGHTLTSDQIAKYEPSRRRGGLVNGKPYIDGLRAATQDDKVPEPVRRIFSLYLSTLDQFGVMDVYAANRGLAGTPHPDTSQRRAKKMQKEGKLRSDLTWNDLYALANVHEFVAQTFSSKSFQDKLKTLKSPINTNKTLWQEFISAIRQIFGFPSDSMAAAVVEASVDIAMVEPAKRMAAFIDNQNYLESFEDARELKKYLEANPSQGIADAKDAFRKQFGRSPNQLAGQTVKAFSAEDIEAEIKKYQERVDRYRQMLPSQRAMPSPQPQAATPAPTPEVREARREPAITPQQDRDYLDAVERGDLDAASRVVEDAASRAGFTQRWFHGTAAKAFNVFRDFGRNFIYFTQDRGDAMDWAKNNIEYARPEYAQGEAPTPRVVEAFINADNIFNRTNEEHMNRVVDLMSKSDDRSIKNQTPQQLRESLLEENYEWYEEVAYKFIRQAGFDGAYIFESQDFDPYNLEEADLGILNPNLIKSAETVTRDDQGNIIPLSQRFQPEQADIRYARRQLRELFKAGRPIDDYEGRAPSVNWDAVDMYGVKWDEQTVADFVESPHQFIYSAMLDSGDLTPKVVEMETANEIERMSEDQIRSEYPDEFIDEDVNWRDVRSRMAEESRNSWEYSKQDMAKPTGRGYPPAVVRRTGENTFEVVDGNHRIDLWQEQGFDVMPVWVIDDYLFREDKKRKTPLDTSSYNAEERQKIRNFLELLSQRQSNEGVDPNQFMTSYRTLPEEFKRAIEYSGRATLYRGTESDAEGKTVFPETMTFTRNEGYAKFMGTFQITNKGLPSTGTIDSQKVVQMLNRRANKQFEKEFRDAGWSVGDDEGEVIIVNDPRERMRQALRVGRGRAGMEPSAVEARLQELGFPTGGIIRVVNEPDADFEGRTIILDGKVTGIELNAAAMRDNATIDRVLNHEFAESANADGALNRLVERLTPKEKKEINDTITRLRYEERARTSEEAARAIETLAEAWKGRGFFTRAVARVEAWASKLGFKLTRRAAEYIAARNLAEVNENVRKWHIGEAMANIKGARRVNVGGLQAILIPPSEMRVAYSIAAYHGTPHKIKGGFQLAKVGTGEGAQAYGWGLYFAENIDVAREYQAKLSRNRFREEAALIYEDWKATNPREASIFEDEIAAQGIQSISTQDFGVELQNLLDGFGTTEANISSAEKLSNRISGTGNLYSVELDLNENDIFDWDLPLAEQPAVLEKINKVLPEKDKADDFAAGQYFYMWLRGYKPMTGSRGMSNKEASEFLMSAGIKGIRYLDQGSRAPRLRDSKELRDALYEVDYLGFETIGEAMRAIKTNPDWETRWDLVGTKAAEIIKRHRDNGTYNFVVFDENAIKITGLNGQPVDIRESRREPEAIPTFTEGTPEAATLKEMEASMAKVDAASEAKGGKPETYKISEIASVWMDSGLGERELQDAIVEYTNLTPANAARVAKAIARQYDIQQSIATAFLETQTGLSVEALPEGVTLPKEVDPDRPKPVMSRLFEVFMGVRVPPVKIEVNEKAALKDQIRLKAAANRAAKAEQKRTAEEVVEIIKAMELLGPVRPKQVQALAKRAARVIWTSEKSVEAFSEYAAKVVENANYDADLREAKDAQKRAKQLSKQKKVAMSPQRQILEDVGKIPVNKLDDPRMFAEAVNYYLRGFKDVRSPDYVVIPDAEMESYLSGAQSETQRNQRDLDREANKRLAKKYGIDPDLVNEMMESFDILRQIEAQENREALENLLTEKAIETQQGLKGYDADSLQAEQRPIVAAMLKIDPKALDAEERQRFIRITNNIIYNNQTNGAEYFVAVAKGQQSAREAAQDSAMIAKNRAWINLLPRFVSERMQRGWALELQSVADTFRNAFGKGAMAKVYDAIGMLDLNLGFTKANNTIDQIQEKIAEFHRNLEKKYKAAARNQDGLLAEGVVGFLIQSVPKKDEVSSINQRRDLIRQDIANRKGATGEPDRVAMGNRIEAILNQIDGESVEAILNNMKREFPANHESLVWYKDTLLPQYRDFLKSFDENFNDQANNYDNPNYLTIGFTSAGPSLAITPEEQSLFYNQVSLNPKQSAYTIKRVDYTTLPTDRTTGKPKEIEFNLRRNVFNSLSDQINKAYTSSSWQRIASFMKTPEAEVVFGGAANKDFFIERLNRLRLSRMRRGSMGSGGAIEKAVDSLSVISRKLGTGIALGGIYQWIKQPPDQLITALGSGGRYDLLAKNIAPSTQKAARELLNKFSIGRRGDASAGYKYINQMEGHQNRLERYFSESKWDQAKEQAGKVADVWMVALKSSDFLAASAAWMTYYEGELNKQDIKIDDWSKEAALIESDPKRRQAAAFAEQMTDIYQGSSDPTSMATFAQSGKTGWENLVKAIFVPFNSFAIQQRIRLYSDARDAINGSKGGKGGLAGTVGGLILFHATKRYAIPAISGAGIGILYGLMGVDMDEPDEEKQKEEANKKWRQFLADITGNLLVGGTPQIVESKFIDAINRASYLVSLQLENDSIIDEDGEIMSYDQYSKERSPFYRYKSFDNAMSLGMLEIGLGQAEQVALQTKMLATPEEMEMYTPEEQRLLYFSALSEWLYLMRLNDADFARLVSKARRDMIKAAEEREKQIKKIRSGGR